MTDSHWPADAATRLDKFLASAERLGSRAKAATALERGRVFLNEAEMALSDAARMLAPGDQVRVWHDRPGSAQRTIRRARSGDLDIVYEDAAVIVVNKPAGLLSVPLERNAGVPSVYEQLEAYYRSHGKRKPFPVHRIDQDTSGLVVFAKDSNSQQALRGQFRRQEPLREYWAVVYGLPEPIEGTWRDHLVWDRKALIQKQTHPRDPLGIEAASDYRVLEAFAEASLVQVRLQTGKRNQIRIQARLRGHTLVGERRYVFGPDSLRPIPFKRHALHARRLAFRHPGDGRELSFEAPLPADLAGLLDLLRDE